MNTMVLTGIGLDSKSGLIFSPSGPYWRKLRHNAETAGKLP
jgi:hypothetical protein